MLTYMYYISMYMYYTYVTASPLSYLVMKIMEILQESWDISHHAT